MSQVRPLGARPPPPRAPEGRGRGAEPAPRRPRAPLPPAVRPQRRCPFPAPSSPETQSVLCLSAHSAARSHQLVRVPSHPARHTKETRARAASPPRTPRARPGPAPSEGRARGRTPSARTPRPPPRVSGVWHSPPAGWRGSARTHGPLLRGVPLSPPAKAGESPLRAIPGRAQQRRREGPGAAVAPRSATEPRPAGGPPEQRRVTCAPTRAAPARRSRELPQPPGLHRLLRPSGCRTLPDRAPNPAAQSPSLLFGPPVQPSAAPIGGTRAGSRPITGPAGRRGAEPAPRRGARGTRPAGGARARARGREPRDAAAQWKRCSGSLFFR